jgi:DNA ligase-1
MDPTGYFISEKLDGIRSIFGNGKFISRNNNEIKAPKWFIDKMPKGVVLDGELFTKRGDFRNVMSYVMKNKPVDEEWKRVRFLVFDMPMLNLPFEERIRKLKQTVGSSKYVKVVPHIKIKNKSHMMEIHKKIVKKGGEGIMLRAPGSFYENKRSSTLIKYKTFKDKEAVVQGYSLGSGKYQKMLGKLKVKWYKGNSTFLVGSGFTDSDRKNYLKLFPKGTIIKVKYFEVNESGKPRFPVFIGVRSKKDIS